MSQGYIYTSYGNEEYLKHAVASVVTLRRYDKTRPVALVCSDEHRDILARHSLTSLFDRIIPLKSEHASIVGFKHNVHHYMPFERNLYLDSDMVWCRDPDPLWVSLSIFGFTITGIQISDNFFGGPKNFRILPDILMRRRRRTLNRFGLTYLSRVQSGMIYASDAGETESVCELASSILDRRDETHFQSRLMEEGRSEESCEWSLAMAMSTLKMPVYPWMQGHNSPQLDFIDSYTLYDPDFLYVECTYYCDPFVYSLRGLKSELFKRGLTNLFSLIPGRGDHLVATPYCLHFGWYHQKQPFYDFAQKTWKRLTGNSEGGSLD